MGFSPRAIRFELLGTHYRQKLDFQEKNLSNVENTLKKFDEFFIKLDNIKDTNENSKVDELISKVKQDFESALDDDLNISKALAAIFVFMTEINKIEIGSNNANNIKKTMIDFDSVLGIMRYKKTDIPDEIKQLADERLKAKQEKNFDLSDKLREKIKEKGYYIDDTSEGYILKRN